MSLLHRFTNLFHHERVTADIDEELRSHLEMAAEDAVRNGMCPEDAHRSVRLRFGNPVTLRENTVGSDIALGLESLSRDVKFALRQLRKSTGFTVTAVLTLALGIGATTAIFTLIQQVMLKSLPVAHPGQLWRIGDSAQCCYSAGYTQGNDSAQNNWSLFSWEAYKLFRANTPAFKDLAAFEIGEGNAELAVRRAGSSVPVQTANGEYVSGNFFRTFGISAWRGRFFADADDREGASPVAVMSFRAWQTHGADPSVVGAAWEINGHPFTIIGIAPPGFYGAKLSDSDMPDFWLPLTTEPLIAGPTTRLKTPSLAWLGLIGRVRPGTNIQALQAQLQGELLQWIASHVQDMSALENLLWQKQTLRLTPGGTGVSLMREDYQGSLMLLMLAALCVLLVACANIANLLLARGLRNRPQTAVRAALGASRMRLVRKALVESVMLAVLGGAAGIALAYVGAQLLLRLAFGLDTSVPVHASPSVPVLLFALGVSLLTGILFGIAPAWMSSHAQPIEAMRGANRSVGGHRQSLQKSLVIVQAAVSLVLLSAAALLGQSLRNREHQNFGFDSTGRYLVSIDPKLSNFSQDQLVPLFREIETRLRAVPDVCSVGSVLEAPPGGWMTHDIRIEGQPEPGPRADFLSGWTRVTPGFFPTYRDRIVMGRPIADEDTAATQPVAVVNEAFAKKFFGSRSPIGQHFGPAPARNAGMYEIVGVASNIAFEGGPKEPMYFLPEAQTTQFENADTENREIWSHYLYNIVLWAPGNPPDLETHVKKALADVDPDLVVYGVQPYFQIIRSNFARENMIASLTSLFGAVGFLLAAVGLYGVTAYGVEQRASEIGVRMALGANRASVVFMVLRSAFLQIIFGLVIGIPAAIAAGHLLASRLFDVTPWDPLLLSSAALLLAFAALFAAFIPARRAANIDPLQTLRSE